MLKIRIWAFGLLLCVGLQPFSFAQGVTTAEGPTTAAVISLEFVSDSAVDNQGNLFIFQTVSQKSAALFNLGTRVTVVTQAKAAIGPREYTGTFSSIVAGEQAIYAISTAAAAANSTKGSRSDQMNLVALRLNRQGNLDAVLPTFSLDAFAQIKIVPGQPDLIYLIHTSPVLLKAIGIPVVKANLVHLVQFDGSTGTFKDLGEVSLP
jgi:hypothetical protein